MTSLFAPVTHVSNKIVKYLLFGQIAGLLIVWFFSPFIFLPTPVETAHAVSTLWQAGITSDLLSSLYLNVEAVGLSIIISLALAYAYTIPFFKPMVQSVTKLRFLSIVGLTFFFTLATHNQHQLKVSLLVFSISVFFTTSMVDVVIAIPKDQYDLGRTLRLGNWSLLKEIVAFGQIDKAFDVLRQNAAMGWSYLTMIEGLARADGGMGAILLNQSKYFHLSEVLAIQLIILTCGLGQDYLLGYVKDIVCPYAKLVLEHK